MTETLAPKVDQRTQPLSERWGCSAGLGFNRSLATSFTEGGFGLDLQLKCNIAESLTESYSPTVQLSLDLGNGRYFPSSDYNGVPGYNTKDGSLMFGLGRTERNILSYGDDTSIGTAFLSSNTPLIGPGWRKQEQADQTVDGVTSSFDSTDTKTLVVANDHSWALEMRPSGRWPTITLGVDLMLGTQFAGMDSKYNRMFLKGGFSLSIGYGDAAVNARAAHGPLADIYAFEFLGHSLISRLVMNATLSDQQDALNNYLGESTGGENGRGSGANIPLFTSLSAFFGASDSITPIALQMSDGMLAAVAVIRGIGGAAFLASGSEAGKVGGGVDLMNALRLGVFTLANVQTTDAGEGKSDSARNKVAIINAANFAVGALLMALGAAADSPTMMKIGAAGDASVAKTPDPAKTDLVERTDWHYILSFTNAENGRSRGGFEVSQSWRGLPLFSSISVLSPSLLPGNGPKQLSQDEPYANINENSDLDAAMGGELRIWAGEGTELRFSGGPVTKAIFGGDSSSQAGIGVTAGIDIAQKLTKRFALSAGISATAAETLPGGNGQVDIRPRLGFSWY